jgi:hypothetical protein
MQEHVEALRRQLTATMRQPVPLLMIRAPIPAIVCIAKHGLIIRVDWLEEDGVTGSSCVGRVRGKREEESLG